MKVRIVVARSSIDESQTIPQNPAATNLVNHRSAQPAAAAKFAGHIFAALGNGVVDQVAQIEIPADALEVAAVDAKQRPGVVEVKGVFYLTRARQTLGVILPEIHTQGLQLGESVGERR